MGEVGRERVEQFLRDFEEALGGAEDQAKDIADEVRADLEAHRERHLAEGGTERDIKLLCSLDCLCQLDRVAANHQADCILAVLCSMFHPLT